MADSNQNNGDSGGGLIVALVLAGIAAIGKGIKDHIKGKKLRKKFKQDKEG